LKRYQFDSNRLLVDIFGVELQDLLKNGIEMIVKQSFNYWMKNLFIVKRIKNCEEFYKLDSFDQQRLLSGNEINTFDKKTFYYNDVKLNKEIDSKISKEKPFMVTSQQSQMEDVQPDDTNNMTNQQSKPNTKHINSVNITEDDMRDDESEQIMVPKKISLVKQRKESIENVNNKNQDTINIKLLEAKNIHHIPEHNDLKNMNFDEA